MPKVDYADLYFQYSRSESWSSRKASSIGQLQHRPGRGRARGERGETAFAYSDDISLNRAPAAAEATRAIARSARAAGVQVVKRGRRASFTAHDPAPRDQDKVVLERLENMRSLDTRVTQVMAWLPGNTKSCCCALRRPARAPTWAARALACR